MSRQGIGMTSQRTRERLIQRLMDQVSLGFEVLEAIRSVPRHLFVDESARASVLRGYGAAHWLRPDALSTLCGRQNE